MNAVLFPSDPCSARAPEPSFAGEHRAAVEQGFRVCLYDDEALARGAVQQAFRLVPPAETEGMLTVHRGWMMPPSRYRALHEAMRERGYEMVATPSAYEQVHHFPNAYPLLQSVTAPTVWSEGTSIDAAWEKAKQLAPGAVLVKDFVKSAKHKWSTACFIPDVLDRAHFQSVVTEFLQERGDRFERGLVFRKVLPLRLLREDQRGMPIHDEWRVFFAKGMLLMPQFYPELENEKERFAPILSALSQLERCFFSADFARLEDGSVCVVEVGDGGVSGLPATLEESVFYQALHGALEKALFTRP